MTARCPNGHASQADDFCDTCGAKIEPGQQPPPSGEAEGGSVAPVDQTCPNCQTSNAVDALFCEACGYDFTTGALPRGAVAAPGEGPTLRRMLPRARGRADRIRKRTSHTTIVLAEKGAK